MIVIDGSKGEGGGQIIRNAIVYAILLKKSLQIHSIRAKRSQPGLKAQHVKGIELAIQISNNNNNNGDTLTGATIGSTVLEYHPNTNDENNNYNNNSNKIICDIETAGSICLLLQVALPCWIFTQKQKQQCLEYLELRGGTNADLAPQIDYLQQILLPTLSQHCLPSYNKENNNDNNNILSMTIERRGYYPIGKGIVHCQLQTRKMNHHLDDNNDDNCCIKQEEKQKSKVKKKDTCNFIRPIVLKERGDIRSIHIQSFYAGTVPEWVAQKMANAAYQHIRRHTTQNTNLSSSSTQKLPNPTIHVMKHENAIGNACGIFIVAKTSTSCLFGASSLQKQQPSHNRNTKQKRETPAIVGQRAAQELLEYLDTSSSTVDMWLQDQLILFMALAHGTSTIHTHCLTQHTQTAIDVATIMTGAKFEIHKKKTIPDSRKRKISNNNDKCSSNIHDYGKEGCMDCEHIITCNGIGLPLNRDEYQIQKDEKIII